MSARSDAAALDDFKPSDSIGTPAVEHARVLLSRWVTALAAELRAEYGFGWRATSNAPSTLADLTTEFRSCQLTGLPLRVSSLYCESTIYADATTNHAFRFVHDARHVFLQAGFDRESELLVASCHLARLKHDGFESDSIAYRLLFADTVGQILFLDQTGEFVKHQRRFVLRCLHQSIGEAILAEWMCQ